jgi:hypothetical protein
MYMASALSSKKTIFASRVSEQMPRAVVGVCQTTSTRCVVPESVPESVQEVMPESAMRSVPKSIRESAPESAPALVMVPAAVPVKMPQSASAPDPDHTVGSTCRNVHGWDAEGVADLHRGENERLADVVHENRPSVGRRHARRDAAHDRARRPSGAATDSERRATLTSNKSSHDHSGDKCLISLAAVFANSTFFLVADSKANLSWYKVFLNELECLPELSAINGVKADEVSAMFLATSS